MKLCSFVFIAFSAFVLGVEGLWARIVWTHTGHISGRKGFVARDNVINNAIQSHN